MCKDMNTEHRHVFMNGRKCRRAVISILASILLISGKEDPCTGGEKGRGDSENRLRRAGFRNLEIVTLDGMRHEILNENGREDVYLRILDFIEKE